MSFVNRFRLLLYPEIEKCGFFIYTKKYMNAIFVEKLKFF